jgi:8-oxo-dGTP diphosphatase
MPTVERNRQEIMRPKVGVATFVVKDGRFIMLRRRGAHGQGTWGLPGGHLEFGESWEECAKREVDEEVGLKLKNIRFFAATNDVFEAEDKHYITIFMLADWSGGVASNKEPHRSTEIDWFTFASMPDDVFLPIENLKQTHKSLTI